LTRVRSERYCSAASELRREGGDEAVIELAVHRLRLAGDGVVDGGGAHRRHRHRRRGGGGGGADGRPLRRRMPGRGVPRLRARPS
jgi:hypothetical protein